MYAVGGRALSADQNSGTLERYDPAGDTWTKLDGMPKPTGSVGVTYANGRVVAIGGEATTSVSDAVQAYDIPKGTWSQLPALPTARHGVAVSAMEHSVYAIGGATEPGHIGSTKEADVLDLSGEPGEDHDDRRAQVENHRRGPVRRVSTQPRRRSAAGSG